MRGLLELLLRLVSEPPNARRSDDEDRHVYIQKALLTPNTSQYHDTTLSQNMAEVKWVDTDRVTRVA